ncbi:MAG: AsmA family protein, partial [Bacteroidales bacterium]
MKAKYKKHSAMIFSLLMSFVIILFFLAIFIPFLIKGKVAERVQQEAERMVHASVSFDDLRIDMIRHFPLISFHLEDVVITGTCKHFENDTLLNAQKIEIAITPQSLLSKNGYEITQIALIAPQLSAQVAPDGKVNWNIFKNDTTHVQADPAHPYSYTSFHLNLKKVQIKNGHITFFDLESMHGIECLELDAKLKGNLSANDPLLKLDCNFREINLINRSGALQQQIEVGFEGGILADFSQKKFTFKKNQLTTGDELSSLEGYFIINEDGYYSSIPFTPDNAHLEEVLALVSAMYLKKYNMDDTCMKGFPKTDKNYEQLNLDPARILLLAQQEADSVMETADQKIAQLLSRAQNPLLK